MLTVALFFEIPLFIVDRYDTAAVNIIAVFVIRRFLAAIDNTDQPNIV